MNFSYYTTLSLGCISTPVTWTTIFTALSITIESKIKIGLKKEKLYQYNLRHKCLKAKAMTIYRHVTLKKAIIPGFEEQTM